MEIILAKTCKSLTGSLGRIYGYSITRRDGKFYSIRNPKGPRIRDGHLRFIFECAEMASDGFILSNIKVEGKEFQEALIEAGLYDPKAKHDKWSILPPQMDEMDYHDVLNFKTYYSL